ncbi:MAG: hypothetical protein K0B37_15670 [Bacteroidales bacterium]|nr:hypothetical protein [Bacteroidales bacterium]
MLKSSGSIPVQKVAFRHPYRLFLYVQLKPESARQNSMVPERLNEFQIKQIWEGVYTSPAGVKYDSVDQAIRLLWDRYKVNNPELLEYFAEFTLAESLKIKNEIAQIISANPGMKHDDIQHNGLLIMESIKATIQKIKSETSIHTTSQDYKYSNILPDKAYSSQSLELFINEVLTLEIKSKTDYVKHAKTQNSNNNFPPGLGYTGKKISIMDLSHYNQHESDYKTHLIKLQQLALTHILSLPFDQISQQLKRLRSILNSFEKFWNEYYAWPDLFANGKLMSADVLQVLSNFLILPKNNSTRITSDFIDNLTDALTYKAGCLKAFIEQVEKIIIEEKRTNQVGQNNANLLTAKTFPDSLLHKNRNLLANALKSEFSTEKGKGIRLMLEVLITKKLLVVENRSHKAIFQSLGSFFDRNIGTYQSIWDYKRSNDQVDYESIETRIDFILDNLFSPAG